MADAGDIAGRAVFLDRDGTLIEDRGHLRSPHDVAFYPDTAEALRILQRHLTLFVVTHQPGVASGELTMEQVDAVNRHVVGRLAAEGVRIRAVYVCPHARTDACRCLKPSPFLPQQAAADHGVSLEESYAVGDHPHDPEMGLRFGGTGVYVLTGHGKRHRSEIAPGVQVAEDILEAAHWISGRVPTEPPPYLSVDRAAEILGAGGVVAFPTETVYGLGAVAFDAAAVARVFEVKRRPRFDPLIVHIGSAGDLGRVARDVPEAAARLAEYAWPGPLTVVVPRSAGVPDLVTAGLETVGVRMPSHPVALRLIRRAGLPVAAPSANPFGAVSPTRAADVRGRLGDEIDGIVDGGACDVGVESTIIGFFGDRKVLLRPGGMPIEEIEGVIGPVERAVRAEEDAEMGGSREAPVAAPGMLSRHYAPGTAVRLNDGRTPPPSGSRVARLVFGRPAAEEGLRAGPGGGDALWVEDLSPAGDLREAAARLYAALRRLDALGADLILADRVPNTGLGLAINDRLRRAAAAGGTPGT